MRRAGRGRGGRGHRCVRGLKSTLQRRFGGGRGSSDRRIKKRGNGRGRINGRSERQADGSQLHTEKETAEIKTSPRVRAQNQQFIHLKGEKVNSF